MTQISLLQQKLAALATDGKLCVAFSGGVDSALLVKLACDAGLMVYAVTFDSTLQPITDRISSAKQAECYGALHEVVWSDPLANKSVLYNHRDRCYHCKRALFESLCTYAQNKGIAHVLDGTNLDDLAEYRPGLRALSELNICSPLAELKLTKADVRKLASEIHLDVAKRPSSPCLATRFPYDTLLTSADLRQCAQGEELLQSMGFPVVRLRIHGNLARVEIPKEAFLRAIEHAPKIESCLRNLGYYHVTLDFAGYRSGCYDQEEQYETENITRTGA